MTEADLHAQIRKLLDALGIVYIESRMDKRSTNARGTPDFLFSVWIRQIYIGANIFYQPVACAWEIKLPKKKLKPEQEKMRDRMTRRPNAWRYSVITSIAEAESQLKEMGLIS